MESWKTKYYITLDGFEYDEWRTNDNRYFEYTFSLGSTRGYVYVIRPDCETLNVINTGGEDFRLLKSLRAWRPQALVVSVYKGRWPTPTPKSGVERELVETPAWIVRALRMLVEYYSEVGWCDESGFSLLEAGVFPREDPYVSSIL